MGLVDNLAVGVTALWIVSGMILFPRLISSGSSEW